MDTTSAEALDDDNDLTNLSGFERLDLTAADGGESIDVDTMGFDYVTVSAVADDGGNVDEDFELILQNNSTVVLTGAIGLLADDDTLTATVTDAATTDATLNLVADVSDATINFGTAVANDVETINLTAQGVFTDADEDGVDDTADIATLDVTADAVTSITIDGDADLTLTATATTVTTVNASALTGDLTYTADDGTVTVTGGTGDDALTAAGSGDTLLGGAGNDTLTGANLTTLTGGEGNDTFVLNVPTSVVTYSTITDLSAGDTIQLTATESFVSAELTYANTASFQDVVNLAVNTLAGDDEDAAWFQFGGNTYVVQNDDRTEDTDTDFENGIDGIIEITGLVDLSTASYSQTNGTLEIV
jgi:S-layer protein